MERHTYKVCRVLPRDPEQKMGRPRRDVLMSWEELSEEELEQFRKFQEPRLKLGQIAELDGRIVARGPKTEDVGEGDGPGDAGETADAGNADDTGDADGQDNATITSPVNSADPVAVTEHATRMLWDVFHKHAAASAELREQTNEMNKRAIEQARQLDEALSSMKSRPPASPINVSVEDIGDLLRVGASVIREFMSGAPEREPK